MAEAEAARAALTDAHRLYIQAFWARHAISQEDVKLVFKKTLQKYECVFVSFDSGSLQLVPEHTDLEEFTHQCNTALEPLSFKITKVRQGLGEDEQIAWVLVNTKKDSLVLDTSPFKPWQIKILTFLLERGETIKSTELVNKLQDDEGKKVTVPQIRIALGQLVENAWIEEHDGYISLSMRSRAELKAYLP